MEAVDFSYASVQVLHEINLQLHAGEICALLGPNGAGKSTLQKLIRGSLRPQRGTVLVFGQQPWRGDSAWRARLAFVNDQPAVHPRLSVRENLRFYAGLYGVPATRCEELLAQTGLSSLGGRRAGQVSRGQLQRLAWARALLIGADLLLLDEPTSGLDLESKSQIHALIDAHRGQGHTILLATHDMLEAQRLADRVGILDGGRLLDFDTPEQLCQRHLGQGLGDVAQQPSLERVYQTLTGRSLYGAAGKSA